MANIKYRKMNQDLQESLTKTQAKLKYATSTQIKEMEKLLSQRDTQVSMLKQMLKSNEIQIRTKNKDISYLKNKARMSESRNVLRSVESLPFINNLGSKKRDGYHDVTQSVATGFKTHRGDKLIMSPNRSKLKESGIFDRKIISRSSIKSPVGSKISKRKLKLTDSDTKQVSKDLKILEKSASSSQIEYESENFGENVDPSVANAQMAAEMGIEYPPDFDFEENPNSIKSKDAIFKKSKSPDPFTTDASDPVKFNQNPPKITQKPPSIQGISPKQPVAQDSTHEEPSKPSVIQETNEPVNSTPSVNYTSEARLPVLSKSGNDEPEKEEEKSEVDEEDSDDLEERKKKEKKDIEKY